MNIRKISDQNLYKLCREYGDSAKLWRQRFIGLLPEVNRREIASRRIGQSWLARRGFASFFEFAAKLAGLSHEQVARAINLERKFEDKPVLKSLLVSGEVSINKLARVAAIATVDNEQVLAKQVKLLPQKALETLVRDEKILSRKNEDSLQKPLVACESVRTHKLELAEDVEDELAGLQQKGIDINRLLRDFLRKRKQELAEEKKQIAIEHDRPTRYISIKIKKLIRKEHGSKCSISTCTRPATTIHHSQRFALAATHDPHYLAPLCREHHQLAHGIDRSYLHHTKPG